MKHTLVFDGIFPAELKKMRTCLHAREKFFDAGSPLMTYGSGDTRLGVITQGEADLIRFDYEGHQNLLRHLKQGDPFGNIFIFGESEGETELVATTECSVLLFDYDQLIKPCSLACSCHSHLIHNMIQILSENASAFNQRIAILSERTSRAKLLAYFHEIAKENQYRSFELPMTLSSLADYLFIDRSAMQREMKKLREEGILSSKGRHIIMHLRPEVQ